MLHTVNRLAILLHRNLRAVKDGRLVHVVPGVQVWRRADVVVISELITPPTAHFRVGEVEV